MYHQLLELPCVDPSCEAILYQKQSFVTVYPYHKHVAIGLTCHLPRNANDWIASTVCLE